MSLPEPDAGAGVVEVPLPPRALRLRPQQPPAGVFFYRVNKRDLGNKHSLSICDAPARLGEQAMKYDTLWFATSIAWTLVLLGATFFAIFA